MWFKERSSRNTHKHYRIQLGEALSATVSNSDQCSCINVGVHLAKANGLEAPSLTEVKTTKPSSKEKETIKDEPKLTEAKKTRPSSKVEETVKDIPSRPVQKPTTPEKVKKKIYI